MLLFLYGTLQDPDVFRAVTGRELRGRAALMHDHGTFFMKDKSYPGICEYDSKVAGLVIEADKTDLDRIDFYEEEGSEYFRKSVEVNVDSKVLECQCYFPIKTINISQKVWVYGEWLSVEKNTFLLHADSFMMRYNPDWRQV